MKRAFEKLGVWVWMAGEAKTRGASFTFSATPTHMTKVMTLSLLLIICCSPILTSCKSRKIIETATQSSQHYTISSLSIDSTYDKTISSGVVITDITIEVLKNGSQNHVLDSVFRDGVVHIHKEVTTKDTTTTEKGHLEALQSKIDSSAYTYTIEEKKSQHNANLFSVREYLFIAAILLLVLLIMARRNSNISP